MVKLYRENQITYEEFAKLSGGEYLGLLISLGLAYL